MTVKNTFYFYQQLKALGFDKKSIQQGTGLSAETIENIESNKQFVLSEDKFSLLLGFYCVEICKSKQPYQVLKKPSKAAVFEQSCLGYQQQSITSYFQNTKACYFIEKLDIQNALSQRSYLTIREQQVLYYLLQKVTKVKCAEKLNISVRTIDYHCQRLCIRLKIVHYRQITDHWFVVNASQPINKI